MKAVATKSQKSVKATKKTKAIVQVSKGKIVAQPAPKTLDNCYRQGGGYWSAVQALRELGINKMHALDKVLAAYKKAMGASAWKEVASQKSKLTADEKALLNVSVTARKDYGAPLAAIGYVVKWDGRAKQAGLFKAGK
jgi:hypothetical protein